MDYCNKLPDAKYAVSTMNITSLPVAIRFGVCLPAACKLADYELAGIAITNTINPII